MSDKQEKKEVAPKGPVRSVPIIKAQGMCRIIDKDGNVKAELPIVPLEEDENAT